MFNVKRFDSEKLWLVILVVLAAALRIFFLLKFENMPGDAVGNVERALLILENPSLSQGFDGNSSTLYKYAIASFVYFWRDPVLAPRVFTLLFGVFLVLPYYGTLKVLFDQKIAFFSTLILVLYPLHIIQSSVTTPDAVYYFFLFSSFYYFFGYQSGQRRLPALWLSALLFNIASLLRFESWIFIPVFFFLLWPKEKKTALSFLVLSVIFPCTLLCLNRIFQHDFLYSFNVAAKTGHASIASGRFAYDPRLWSWLVVLWEGSGPSFVIGGFLGILLAFLTRQKRQLAIFFLILWFAFTSSTLSARMVPNRRYALFLALSLIPYAWFFVDRALSFLKIRRTIFFILCCLIPIAGFFPKMRKMVGEESEMFCATPPEILNIAAWLKGHVRAGETLVIEADSQDVFPSNILIRSGISPEKCFLVYTPLSRRWSLQKNGPGPIDVLGRRPDYLVLNSDGFLREILRFDFGKKWQSVGTASFRAVFEQEVPGYGTYVIYRSFYQE